MDNERERRDEEEEETGEIAINLNFSVIRRTVFHEIVMRNETKTCAPVNANLLIIAIPFRMIFRRE